MAKEVIPGKYKNVFFDLDHTLWDYETNSRETLQDLYESFSLNDEGVSDFENFYQTFKEVNLKLWDLYDKGIINTDVIRKERFEKVLAKFFVVSEKLSNRLSVDYLQQCPTKCNLMPHAMDTLHYLSSKYNLTIITNGFEDTQQLKLNSGDIHNFFNYVITSQRAGHKKPARQIFEYALKLNNIQPSQAIMIGDNLVTDMQGARNASIDTVFYNPDKVYHDETIDYEIASLNELCTFL